MQARRAHVAVLVAVAVSVLVAVAVVGLGDLVRSHALANEDSEASGREGLQAHPHELSRCGELGNEAGE